MEFATLGMTCDCLLLQFLKEVPYSNEKEILRAPDKYASCIYSEDGKLERLKNLTGFAKHHETKDRMTIPFFCPMETAARREPWRQVKGYV